MAGDELFEDLPEQAKPQTASERVGAARLREPKRDQVELRATDLDSLIGEDHLARLIWDYVEGLDLRELEARIKARDDRPGHPATSPWLLLALWLYAMSEGVGSARALARLCECHDGYRWLCGGVSVNYHLLADFRVECAEVVDRLLAEHLAALAKAELIDLDALMQDGIRVRASAGAPSFRREATLDRLAAVADAMVQGLKAELEASPDASNQRLRAAKERARRERKERIDAARKVAAEVKEQRRKREEERPNGKKPKEPRASTTDPDARVMKMADGGFRPAYNVQVASVAGEQIVVAVDVSNNGSDRGLMRPMLERLHALTGHFPGRYLVDGGFCSAADIEWGHSTGTQVYCPPVQSKHGTDPYRPRRGDGPGVLAWRARMADDEGKAQYKLRSIGECIHARWRNWGLKQLNVRGIEKVRANILLYALTNNILQGYRLAGA